MNSELAYLGVESPSIPDIPLKCFRAEFWSDGIILKAMDIDNMLRDA